MTEYDIIRSFSQHFKRSNEQQNGLFESDAELIKIGDQLWALTMDEFTPEEDLFTSENPVALGANLAVATLSDLFASGADPVWYMHSVSFAKSVDSEFIEGLSKGINSVVDEVGCSVCGGDMGCAVTWRYCGFAMGHVLNNRPLTRKIPNEPQSLWVTGSLGDANLAALSGSATPCFELRYDESKVIRSLATACIDTSGGFFDSQWMLHELNPGLRLEIDLDCIPYASGLRETAASAGFPIQAALLGGAGEYELLFSVPEGTQIPLDCVTCVGQVRPDGESGVYLLQNGRHTFHMTEPPPCPRDAATVEDHIRDVILMAKRLKT
jgi:thiamine-monophosphate kinase